MSSSALDDVGTATLLHLGADDFQKALKIGKSVREAFAAVHSK
jgi:hypothetical protein